jgi:hypothetical protein
MINFFINFFDSFSFDLIDSIQLALSIIVSLVSIIILVMTKKQTVWKLGILGLIMVSIAISVRTICQIFSLDMIIFLDSYEVSIQYTVVTFLYVIGLVITGIVFIPMAVSEMRKK